MLSCASSFGAVAQFGRAPESHSGGRRFDPGQLHQQEFPLNSATMLRIAARLLDRTGDLRGLGGRSPPPDQHRAGRRRRRRPVRSRSAPPTRIPAKFGDNAPNRRAAGAGAVHDGCAHRDLPRSFCGLELVESERGREVAVRIDLRLQIGDLLLRGGDGIGAGDKAARR